MEAQPIQPVQPRQPVDLKVAVEIQANGKPLRILAQVEGEGELAQQVAAQLSSAIAAAIAQASSLVPSPEEGAVKIEDENPPGEAPGDALDDALLVPSTETEPQLSRSAVTSSASWIQRNRMRVSLGFGGLLLALAVLVPIIVPSNQRSEVLIMTILFGLTGSLLLFTALLPARGPKAAESTSTTARSQVSKTAVSTPTPTMKASRSSFLQHSQPKPMNAGWGIAIGLIFVIAGILAPFTLSAVTADERFIIMVGFAPVAIVGLFMIAIFGRSLLVKVQLPSLGREPSHAKLAARADAQAQSQPAPGHRHRRAPVTRVPQRFDYQVLVPAAIGALLVLLIVVVGVVILATIAPLVR